MKKKKKISQIHANVLKRNDNYHEHFRILLFVVYDILGSYLFLAMLTM